MTEQYHIIILFATQPTFLASLVIFCNTSAQPTVAAAPNPTQSAPRVINVEKNAAYPKAIAELKAAGILPEAVELRQVKYLNNLIEQDHRAHQTTGQTGAGFLFLGDGVANPAGIRGDEHD